MKTRLMVLLLAIGLTSCTLRPELTERRYLLAQDSMPAVLPIGMVGINVHISAAAWLDQVAMQYRLAYDDPQALHRYRDSLWAERPTAQLALRLNLLGLNISTPEPDGARVEIELIDFAQYFSSPNDSVARIAALVVRRDSTGRVLARSVLRAEAPAGQDAASGVRALSQATDSWLRQLVRWLGETA